MAKGPKSPPQSFASIGVHSRFTNDIGGQEPEFASIHRFPLNIAAPGIIVRPVPGLDDESDFIDTEFHSARGTDYRGSANTPSRRAPTQEELEARNEETQRKLQELKLAQQRLEEERVALEESRRRRADYHSGREEMLTHLTRGVGLLQKVEFEARQRAEESSRTLQALQQHLQHLESLNDQAWTEEHYSTELTSALTAIESARTDWTDARLKWSCLSEARPDEPGTDGAKEKVAAHGFANLSFGQLCRIGLALTWPISLVVLLAAVAVAVAWFTKFQ